MTNYNKRLDEVLDSYAGYYNLQDINRFTKEQMSIEFPHLMTKDESKQAIKKLIADEMLGLLKDEPEDGDDYPFEYGKQYGRNQLRAELRTKLAKWLNQPTYR